MSKQRREKRRKRKRMLKTTEVPHGSLKHAELRKRYGPVNEWQGLGP